MHAACKRMAARGSAWQRMRAHAGAYEYMQAHVNACKASPCQGTPSTSPCCTPAGVSPMRMTRSPRSSQSCARAACARICTAAAGCRRTRRRRTGTAACRRARSGYTWGASGARGRRARERRAAARIAQRVAACRAAAAAAAGCGAAHACCCCLLELQPLERKPGYSWRLNPPRCHVGDRRQLLQQRRERLLASRARGA